MDCKRITKIGTFNEFMLEFISRRQHLLFLTFLLIVLTSCTKYITMYPLPQLTGGSPLRGIPPASFVVNDFEDQRLEKEYIGVIGVYKVKAKEELRKVVPDALKAELERNGHIINQANGSGRVDFIIDGSLINYYCIVIPGTWSVTGNSRVEAVINVKNAKTGEVKLTKKYSGFYEKKSALGISGRGFQDLLDEALKNTIKEFTMDPQFLDLLQDAER